MAKHYGTNIIFVVALVGHANSPLVTFWEHAGIREVYVCLLALIEESSCLIGFGNLSSLFLETRLTPVSSRQAECVAACTLSRSAGGRYVPT